MLRKHVFHSLLRQQLPRLNLHNLYNFHLLHLKLNDLQKRSDLLIYNNRGEKIVLAEFKAPHIKITQANFEQIPNYNSIHKIPLLLVSNGLEHYYCKIDFQNSSFIFIEELPSYDQLLIEL